MPGTRLDREERRRIAGGLAAGTSLAAIARELGRPTSTVSREVARNGGRDAYRASDAQRTAHARARRSPAPETAPPRDTAAVDAYVERFAEVMVYTGLARTPSRVFARLLVTDSGALTARELGAYLGVSPAAVSRSVEFLERFALISRERLGRRQRYRIRGDAWEMVFARRARLFDLWRRAASEGVAVAGADTPSGHRLARMSAFFGLACDMAERTRREWEAARLEG